ncbi:MAG TPA: hypothetical protein VMJ10_18660 [Kofleriaceae bacterium]|nr:hypothetical protein [Kofleriaceae bacterium]
MRWLVLVVLVACDHTPHDAVDASTADAPIDTVNDAGCPVLARSSDPCLGATPACMMTCADTDQDGLNDAWELAGGIDLDHDGAIDACHDVLLSGADVAHPDIFVIYDWLDYAPAGDACNVTADCTSSWGSSHAGETCTGPAVAASYTGSCEFACTTDADCTGRANPGSRIGDRCIASTCQHTHDPEALAPGALAEVVAAFALHGTNLHVVRGHAVPHSQVVSMRGPTELTDACEGGSPSSGTAGVGKYAASLYDLKALHAVDRLAYHYVVFAHYVACDTTAHCDACPYPMNADGTAKATTPNIGGTTGLAELPGNDAIVSLGARVQGFGYAPTVLTIASTFMHELGHNLGLHHGGGVGVIGTPTVDDTNWKPNYLSVMNYRYEFTGVEPARAADDPRAIPCTTAADCPSPNRCFGGGCARLDYSEEALRTLDERHLDETVTLGATQPDLITFTDAQCDIPASTATSAAPVDWDGDGQTTSTDVTADLTSGVDHACGSEAPMPLIGELDWPPSQPGAFLYGEQCSSWGAD